MPSPYSGSPYSAGGGRPEGRSANRPCGPAHLYRHSRPGGGHHRHRLPKPRLLLRPGGSRPTAGPGGMAPRGPCHWHRRPRRLGEHPRPRIPPSLVAKAIWVAPFRKKGPCHPAGTSALSYYLPQRGNELIHRLRLGGPAGAQPQRHPALPAPLLIVGAARPQGIGLLLT